MEQFTILPLFVVPCAFFLIFVFTQLSSIIPSNYQIFNESLLETITKMVDKKDHAFVGLFFGLFYLILLSNFIGLIPYSTTASTEIIITIFLALGTLGGIFIYAILRQGTKISYMFLPSGTPLALLPLMIILEIVSYIARTFSLGLRLAVNLITGHILVKIVISFVPSFVDNYFALASVFVFLTMFLALEILISYLQAYIFLFITLITLKDFS